MSKQRSVLKGSGISILFVTFGISALSVLLPMNDVEFKLPEIQIEDTTGTNTKNDDDDNDDHIKPVTEKESDETSHYYRNTLEDENLLTCYDTILESLTSREESFVVPTSTEDAQKLYSMVMNDHPEIFWADESYSYAVNNISESVTIEPNYYLSEEEIILRQEEIDVFVDALFEEIDEQDSTYDRVQKTYDYLIDNITYVQDAPDNQNIYSALGQNHETVCAGYAKSTLYILQKLGVNSIYVSGEITIDDGGPHAWNIVQIEDEWYQVDTTWGDMGIEDNGFPENFFPNHAYLCTTSEEMSRSRITDENLKVPECVATTFNYYEQNNLMLDSYSNEELSELLKVNGADEGSVVTYKFTTKEEYIKCKNDLETSILGDATFNYAYSYNDELYIIYLWLL